MSWDWRDLLWAPEISLEAVIVATAALAVGVIAVVFLFTRILGGGGARRTPKEGDITVIVADAGTKTIHLLPAEMLSPNIYLTHIKDEPLYVLVPSDKYVFRDSKGRPVVFCSKFGGVIRPLNPDLESAVDWLSESKEFKDLKYGDAVKLVSKLSEMHAVVTGCVPIGTKLDVCHAFKPKEVLLELLHTIASDNVKVLDFIASTVSNIERIAKAYEQRIRLMRERRKLIGLVPAIIIAIGVVLVLYLLFAR